MPVFGVSLLICLLNLLNTQLQTLSMFQHLLYMLDKREIKIQCVSLEESSRVTDCLEAAPPVFLFPSPGTLHKISQWPVLPSVSILIQKFVCIVIITHG